MLGIFRTLLLIIVSQLWGAENKTHTTVVHFNFRVPTRGELWPWTLLASLPRFLQSIYFHTSREWAKKIHKTPTNFDEKLSLGLGRWLMIVEQSALSNTPGKKSTLCWWHKNAISHAGTFRNYSPWFYPVQLFQRVMFCVLCPVFCMQRSLTTHTISARPRHQTEARAQKQHYSRSHSPEKW